MKRLVIRWAFVVSVLLLSFSVQARLYVVSSYKDIPIVPGNRLVDGLYRIEMPDGASIRDLRRLLANRFDLSLDDILIAMKIGNCLYDIDLDKPDQYDEHDLTNKMIRYAKKSEFVSQKIDEE